MEKDLIEACVENRIQLYIGSRRTFRFNIIGSEEYVSVYTTNKSTIIVQTVKERKTYTANIAREPFGVQIDGGYYVLRVGVDPRGDQERLVRITLIPKK